MTTTDLKRGDFAEHPEKGRGYVQRGGDGRLRVIYASQALAWGCATDFDLTGWERVETCTERERTILDIYQRVSRYGYTYLDTCDGVVMERRRADEESTAQRAESTPPGDEKPMSATVTLYCPDCGEPITNTAMVEVNREGERYLDFCNVNVHTCPPAQPDEPTDFGARVSVTRPDGSVEKWLRAESTARKPWISEVASGERSWNQVKQRGTVTLGWDE